MYKRLINLPKNHSFFLFGARGTGKSTLLRSSEIFKDALYIDLLKPDEEEVYSLKPDTLISQVHTLKKGSWVILDEIQKVPKLLDVVHNLIEEKKVNFALTGSSSRKLKRGGGNLLAGRAFLFNLFPFSYKELNDAFILEDALNWGNLPKIHELESNTEKARFLRSYVQTYIKEEILVEQLVRNLDPFRLFLPIAAQMNSEIINYSNISKDTGVDYKTIQNYFQILVDTCLGFFLEPYSKSVRKVQKQSPKFYFFDMGVKKSLQNTLNVETLEQTSDFGGAFESWFVNECMKLNSYKELDYKFSYLRTKDDMEIDLIIERPGLPLVLVEIKSAKKIDDKHIKSLVHFSKDFPKAQLICASRVQRPQKVGNVNILPWKQALEEIGLG